MNAHVMPIGAYLPAIVPNYGSCYVLNSLRRLSGRSSSLMSLSQITCRLNVAAAAALVRPVTDLLAAHDAGTAVTAIARAEQFQAARLATARRGAGRERR
jgi:hypothetical protein